MDTPVAKSEFEAHIKKFEEQNESIHSKMEALGQKIDLLSRKFERNICGSSSVPTPELGLDGPIQGEHMIAMEHTQG